MRSHPRECYKALFEAAKETLFALARDPKYIGSPNFGATGVLHTWGRDLNYHPHLHFIVPGGAIGLDAIPFNYLFNSHSLPFTYAYGYRLNEIFAKLGFIEQYWV